MLYRAFGCHGSGISRLKRGDEFGDYARVFDGAVLAVKTERRVCDAPPVGAFSAPEFDDERVGILLACTGAIKDDILDVETLGCKLMELLAEQAPQTIIDRYSIAIPEEECDFLGYELLQQAGRRRGFLLRGGEIDTERMARILLDEFRGGVLGRITLEKPE